MANLLSYTPSFNWQDPIVDRSEIISNLNVALVEAKRLNDGLFKTPDLDNIILPWGNFVEFIFYYGYDDDARKAIFPWMTEIQHTTLLSILIYLKNTSSKEAIDLHSLQEELNTEECAYIGFVVNVAPEDYIFSLDSLVVFHRKIVSEFDYEQRCNRTKYFKTFFVPTLKISPNQIKYKIDNHRTSDAFERIEIGKILGEQLHIHFAGKNPCALNLDGTWKHPNPKYRIPVDACRDLCKWGFQLPNEYYP